MSLVRWSKDSDLYIFEHVDGFLECYGCCLIDGNFQTKSKQELTEHVQWHVNAGHLVPEELFGVLEDYVPESKEIR